MLDILDIYIATELLPSYIAMQNYTEQGQWNISAELQIHRCYRATPSYRAVEGVYSVEIFVLFAEAERARPVHCVVTAPLFEANILISPLL